MRNVYFACVCSIVLCISSCALAGDVGAKVGISHTEKEKNDTTNCWVEAGRRYGIEPWLLYSIAEHESKLKPGAIGPRNSDGTYDIGIMQVNSWWLPILAKRFGIYESHLFEPCMNINVGAWILAQAVRSMGPTWEAVGAYNAGVKRTKTRDLLRKKYSDRIAAVYARHNRLRNTAGGASADRP